MKTILLFENEERSCKYNALLLRRAREFYPEEILVMISAGNFSSCGTLLRPSCSERSGEYVNGGADLVLSLPAASVLGGYGKKEFAGAALVQRLRSVDRLVIPCTPVSGQSLQECERDLRACAMRMFRADPDYRELLTRNLADNLPFREAQLRAVCTCMPEHQELLSFRENRQALWLLDSMLQLYYIVKADFIDAPEDQGGEACKDNTQLFEKAAASKISELLDDSSMEQWIDIAGSSSQMVTDLFENKERIRAAGSLEEISLLLRPASSERARLFLLKAMFGVRKIYMQICGLHVYVPYCYVSAKNPDKEELLSKLEERSWVPFIGNHEQEQNMIKEYPYLLQADKKAEI